jgi:hypothetical protein
MAKPPKSILDPTFKYSDSASTDIRKTFAKARRRKTEPKPQADLLTNVTPIKRRVP